jgi:hypothetical protein
MALEKTLFLLFLALFLHLAAFAVVFIRLAVLGAAAERTAGAMLALLLELSAALLFYFLFSAHGEPL